MAGKICPGALAEAHHLSELMYSVARVKWWLLEFICFMRSPYKLCNRPVLKLNNVLTRRPSRKKSQALFLGTFLQRLWIVSSNQGRHFQVPSLPPWTLQASRRMGWATSFPLLPVQKETWGGSARPAGTNFWQLTQQGGRHRKIEGAVGDSPWRVAHVVV